MSVMDWLTILIAIASAALTGGVSYGLQRGRIRGIEQRLDRQDVLLDKLLGLMLEREK